jgi:Asp-tRNA(Asn)/Glu-tRNA(Gln) amidotransferase A subunit family amidase
VELHEYARCDGVGLRELITTGQVTAAEVEAVARKALDAANTEVNGLALPLFSPALDQAGDGPLAGVPFLIKDSWLQSIFAYGPFTVVFNISGQPALSLPLGQSKHGLPIGVQFVAPLRPGGSAVPARRPAGAGHALGWPDPWLVRRGGMSCRGGLS